MVESTSPRVIGEVERVPYGEVFTGGAWERCCAPTTGRPLHVTGVPQLCALHERWSDDFINQQVGEQVVSLDYSADGTFPGGALAYDGVHRRQLEMPVSQAIAEIRAGSGTERKERLYVYGSNTRPFEKLLEGYTPPTELIAEGSRLFTQVWLGGAGNVTPAHFDVADNVLGQIHGTKRLLLWAPSNYPHLYVNPTGARHERHSQLGELEQVDLARYPKFARAEALSCELGPGELLFIPLGWFHYVRTLDFALSINHFWHAPDMKAFLDAGFYFLRGEVRPELLSLMVSLMMERQGLPLDGLAQHCPRVAP